MTAACCPPAEMALDTGKAGAVDLGRFVQSTGEGACHLDLAVDGIHCAACIRTIESGLADAPGVDGVRVNFGDGWALVRASNTQPALTLRFEAQTGERLLEIRRLVEETLARFLPPAAVSQEN